MGVPNFLSRVKDYAVTEVIGRKAANAAAAAAPTASQSTTSIAVIDGPSLAHFLCEKLILETYADHEIEVECFVKYATLGERAVQWLNNLRSFGFEIEGIYFDGSLPGPKRHTRLDRLERTTARLIQYRKSTRRYAPFLRPAKPWALAYCYESAKKSDRRRRKELPPPAFLVAAVIEALKESTYADRTWVVDGEADAFCAAAAIRQCFKARDSTVDRNIAVSIFTNDSDLLIWETGIHHSRTSSRVVMIGEINQRIEGTEEVMRATTFYPMAIAKRCGQTLDNLILPAFKMLLDSNIQFRKAMESLQIHDDDEENLNKFIMFAAKYDYRYPLAKLYEMEQSSGSDVIPRDPRVAELINLYLSALLRMPELDPYAARRRAYLDAIEHSDAAYPLAVRAAQEPRNPFYKGDSQTMDATSVDDHEADSKLLPPMRLDLEMFLPALLEDPDRSSAWQVGEPFRRMSSTLIVLPLHRFDREIREHRKSGSGVNSREVEIFSSDEWKAFIAETWEFFKGPLLAADELGSPKCWRYYIMQLTIHDIEESGKPSPPQKECLDVINGKKLSTWSLLHLFARYQAEYYSVMMLKQVLEFCWSRPEFPGLEQSLRRLGMLKHLPNVGTFFEVNEADIGADQWDVVTGKWARDPE